MPKKIAIATVAIVIAWFILDNVIHGVLLMPAYEQTASLWRPVEEMKPWLMWIVILITALCLVLVYALYFKRRNLKTGLVFALLTAVAWDAGMGYGTTPTRPSRIFWPRPDSGAR